MLLTREDSERNILDERHVFWIFVTKRTFYWFVLNNYKDNLVHFEIILPCKEFLFVTHMYLQARTYKYWLHLYNSHWEKYILRERSKIQSIGKKLSLTGVMYVSYIHVGLNWYFVVGLVSFPWWYLPISPTSQPRPTHYHKTKLLRCQSRVGWGVFILFKIHVPTPNLLLHTCLLPCHHTSVLLVL